MDMIAGKIPPQIAKELNAEGVPTPLEYKKITRKGAAGKPIWTHHRIIDMIKNMKYTGCMVNHTRESRKIRDKAQRRVPKEEWIIHENAHEAIIPLETSNRAITGYIRQKPGSKKGFAILGNSDMHNAQPLTPPHAAAITDLISGDLLPAVLRPAQVVAYAI